MDVREWLKYSQAMVMAAALCVMAAFYAVSAWGQEHALVFASSNGLGDAAGLGAGLGTGAGNKIGVAGGPTNGLAASDHMANRLAAPSPFTGPATVSVATLQVPQEAWKHFDRARTAQSRGRADEFERESLKALAIAPRFAEAYLLRASSQISSHQYEQAIASVEAARRADPGARWCSILLASAYNGLHRYHDALLVLNADHGPQADSWQAIYERSRAVIGSRDVEASLRWSARALAAAPREFSDAHLLRANALMLGDRLREAEIQMDLYLAAERNTVRNAEVLAMRDSVHARLQAAPLSTQQTAIAAAR